MFLALKTPIWILWRMNGWYRHAGCETKWSGVTTCPISFPCRLGPQKSSSPAMLPIDQLWWRAVGSKNEAWNSTPDHARGEVCPFPTRKADAGSCEVAYILLQLWPQDLCQPGPVMIQKWHPSTVSPELPGSAISYCYCSLHLHLTRGWTDTKSFWDL